MSAYMEPQPNREMCLHEWNKDYGVIWIQSQKHGLNCAGTWTLHLPTTL